MLSSYHGHTPLVTLLLQHGADPNRLNDRGQSPLAGAVFKNEREVIRALLAGNADPRVGEPSALDACKVCFRFSGGWTGGM
jgi:ankyrin repeat protein